MLIIIIIIINNNNIIIIARFSPDDKFSRERITCKKRFGIHPTQMPGREY